jgi:hypothetical protein
MAELDFLQTVHRKVLEHGNFQKDFGVGQIWNIFQSFFMATPAEYVRHKMIC